MSIRETLSRALAWGDAHVSFDDAVKDLDPLLRGVRPQGFPHSAWELLEHLRLAQEDILEFCVSDSYRHREWPKQYWPAAPEPPSDEAWETSIIAYRKDRLELQRLTLDESIDLAAAVPYGTGQTWIRELVLVLDHAAYHVAQLVMVRQALGAWKR
jgi:hypothetical protein